MCVYDVERGGKLLKEDKEDYNDDDGRIIGRTYQIEDIKLYILSVYAPVCDTGTQVLAKNMAFLKQIEKVVMDKKKKGLEVILAGDLNFIRDDFLDADGGRPKVYTEQNRWMQHM